MKTVPANYPQLPGLRTILPMAAVFAVPVVLWGDRWPWLVVIPVAIMAILTVRSEWLRIQALDKKKNVQVLEATFIPDVMIFDKIAAWESSCDWSTHVSIPEENWIITGPPDSREVSNIIDIADYDTFRPVVDEKLTAVA